VVEGRGVWCGALDAEPKEFTDAADVAAGGADLVEDPVLAKGLGRQIDLSPGEGPAHLGEAGCGSPVDEQVRVCGPGPGLCSVVEPRSEPRHHGRCEGNDAAAEGEAPVDDVGEGERPDLTLMDHQKRISRVVGPSMVAGAVTALILLFDRPATMSGLSAWVAAGLLGVALLSTVLIRVPLHIRLAEHHDADAVRRLIVSNWVRTTAWTARGVVLAGVLAS
jgi:hypothetical protein